MNDFQDYLDQQEILFNHLGDTLRDLQKSQNNSGSQMLNQKYLEEMAAMAAELGEGVRRYGEKLLSAVEAINGSGATGSPSAVSTNTSASGSGSSKHHAAHSAEATESKESFAKKFFGALNPTEFFKEGMGFLKDNFETLSFGLIIKSMDELSDATSGMLRSMGSERLSAFTSRISELQATTGLTTDGITELGSAFENEGLSLASGLNPELTDYLTISGQAMKLLDLSAETAAHFATQLKETGSSATDVRGVYEGLVTTMQDLNLTVNDVAASIKEASSLFDQFGGVAGKDVGAIAQTVEKLRGFYKGMGLDANDAAKNLQSLLADPNKRMQVEAAVSTMTGKHIDIRTAGGQMAALSAGVQQTLNSGVSENDPQYQLIAKQAADMVGLNTGTILKEATEYLHSNEHALGKTFDVYMATKLAEAAAEKSQTQSWDQMSKAFQDSFGQLNTNLGRFSSSLAILVGLPLLDLVNPLLGALNELFTDIIKIANVPLVKTLIDWGVKIGILFGVLNAALLPLMSAIGSAVAAVTGFVESISAFVVGFNLIEVIATVGEFVAGIAAAASGVGEIVAVFAAIGAAVYLVQQHWDAFLKAPEIQEISKHFTGISDSLGKIGDRFSKVLEPLGKSLEHLGTVLAGPAGEMLIKLIAGPLLGALNLVVSGLDIFLKMLADSKNLFDALATPINFATHAIDGFADALSNIISWIGNLLHIDLGGGTKSGAKAIDQGAAAQMPNSETTATIAPGGMLTPMFSSPIASQMNFAPPIAAQSSGGMTDIGHGFKLQDDAAKAFLAAQNEAAAHGVAIHINSAFRSLSEQASLYAQKHGKQAVALPGHSDHNFGRALDIQNYAQAMPYLVHAGFVHGGKGGAALKNDPWHFHFDPSTGQTVSMGGVPAPPPMTPNITDMPFQAYIPSQSGEPNMPPNGDKIVALLEQQNGHLEKISSNQHAAMAKADQHHMATKTLIQKNSPSAASAARLNNAIANNTI